MEIGNSGYAHATQVERQGAPITNFLRNHTQGATVGIALGLVGLGLLYNGTLDVPDVNRTDRLWIIGICLTGGMTSALLSLLALTRRIRSPQALEAAMFTGLLFAIATNGFTGAVWEGSLRVACGYTMLITVAAGLTLRTPLAFSVSLALLLAAWVAASALNPTEVTFEHDANTLVFFGGAVATSTFLLLHMERGAHATMNRQLKTQRDHDVLTGVLNRSGLIVRAEHLRNPSIEAGELWCAYLDVDYFKQINDQMGHDYGDDVLREIAAGLGQACPEDALVSRWGGDEFVVIARGKRPTDEALESAVRGKLAQRGLDATISAGVASDQWTDGSSLDDLIKRADLRMYSRRDTSRAHPE